MAKSKKPRRGGKAPAPAGARGGAVDRLMQRATQLHQAGRVQEAQAQYRQVLAMMPEHAQAQHLLGVAHRALGEPQRGVELMQKALAKRPHDHAIHSNLARALRETGRREEAVQHFRRAVELKPDFVQAWSMLANLLREMDRLEESAAAGAEAVKQPDFAEGWLNYGNALRGLGKLEQAEHAYRQALSADAGYEEAYYALSEMVRFEADDPLIPAMKKLFDARQRANRFSEQLAFALAKAYHDTGMRDPAFDLWLTGNRQRRQSMFPGYAVDQDLARMRRIAATFTPERMARAGRVGHDDPTPIFILGMPRSGTTLIEQILSSHAEVAGAGELEDMRLLAHAQGRASGAGFPDWVAGPDGDARLTELGQRYVAQLRARFPEAPRITDKMPPNFFYVGLIRLALPQAKIVHTMRDPLDTCFSCFTKRFTEGNAFSYDLSDLGRYYRGYEALMAHWRTVIGGDALLEVQYEDLVDQFESTVARLLDFCGLAWDPACLRFFETERSVQTASATQVRSPIYRSAIGRAESQYGHCLQPLKDTLAPNGQAESAQAGR